MATTPYDYGRSPLGPGDIRLLKLPKAAETQPLKGTFLRYSTDTPPGTGNEPSSRPQGYEALSYTWGDNNMSCQITIVDGAEEFFIKITQNLKSALQQMRSAKEDLYVWADALCINQGSNKEKSSQIQRMAYIYMNASRVWVWLGDEEEGNEKAFNFIGNLVDSEKSVLEPFAAPELGAFLNLLQKPWFSRRWIVQEITCAKDAILSWGKRTATWNDFADALSLLRRQQDIKELLQESSVSLGPDGIEGLDQLGAVRLVNACDNLFRRTPDGEIADHMLSLESLLSSLSVFESTDPRDTIYAILWLANDATPKARSDYRSDTYESPEDPSDYESDGGVKNNASMGGGAGIKRQKTFATNGLKKRRPNSWPTRPPKTQEQEQESVDAPSRDFIVDYDKKPVEVYKDFLKFCMRSSLDMICWPWVPDVSLGDSKLPTWILPLSKGAFKKSGTYYRRCNADPLVGRPGAEFKPYSAGNGREVSWYFGDTELSLIASGFQIGTVEKKKDTARGNIHKSWRESADWIDTSVIPPDNFWQTLVGNRNSEGQRPPRFWKRLCREAFEKFESDDGILDIKKAINEAHPIMKEFLERVYRVTLNRSLVQLKMQTSAAPIGLAPDDADVNDIVCILHGCSVPVLLRKIKDEARVKVGRNARDQYELVGGCYVNGVMEGEAYNNGVTEGEAFNEEMNEEEFELI